MNDAQAITDPERQELLALYQVTAQDLAFFKGQQWNLTNYTSLALAAIVGIAQLPGSALTSCERLVLSVVASVVVLIAGLVLWRLNSSINMRRQRLERLFSQLSERFRGARGEKAIVSAAEMSTPLTALLIVGLSIVWWLVYFNRREIKAHFVRSPQKVFRMPVIRRPGTL